MRDARTTPPRARAPVVVALSVVITYFVGCFHWANRDDAPRWTTLGGWRMFTDVAHWHADLAAEVKVGDEWRPIELLELFPSQWDSGPRYARGPFRRSRARLSVLADSACDRSGLEPSAVRIYELRWRAFPGVPGAGPPPADARKRRVLHWECADVARRPEAPRR